MEEEEKIRRLKNPQDGDLAVWIESESREDRTSMLYPVLNVLEAKKLIEEKLEEARSDIDLLSFEYGLLIYDKNKEHWFELFGKKSRHNCL